ncbi:hypothetical protein [Rossellomorea aquimaris]|uniref:Uncharacterized protein n=1 Tax=Rossellomorea aquimaris TaxID=189382 RepID=A0A5D4U0U5_9BACI|nr:hypothetical protein [Rossellomorea aquimaris]TYS80829.1 hypothetical protein FZC80_06910 [Rossellomorea aquimaris]
MSSTLYFSDNFFSSGRTDIYNSHKEKVGELDLKSAFSASMDILNNEGRVMASGKFPFMGNRWIVSGKEGEEMGELKQKWSFFSKRFQYHSFGKGTFSIESEAFSKDYTVLDEKGAVICSFERVSGFFSSPAFKLENYSSALGNQELVAVVMGVNAIQKRNNAAASSGGAT